MSFIFNPKPHLFSISQAFESLPGFGAKSSEKLLLHLQLNKDLSLFKFPKKAEIYAKNLIELRLQKNELIKKNIINALDFMNLILKEEDKHKKLKDLYAVANNLNQYDNFNSFYSDIILSAEIEPNELEGNISLSTIHSAKGKEWDHVYILSVDEGVLPNSKSNIEEERRLFYVACTRAKKSLKVYCSPDQESRFLINLIDEYGVNNSIPNFKNIEKAKSTTYISSDNSFEHNVFESEGLNTTDADELTYISFDDF